jgi:hypothetical protein
VQPLTARPTWAAWATLALAGSLALGISWCILHGPLTLNDGLGPILDSRLSESLHDTYESAIYSQGYWRPLRLIQIKIAVDASPSDSTLMFKVIHVALIVAIFLMFAAWIRPRTVAEFAAGGVALMIVTGHHSFFVLFSEAYPINHFLEIAALAVAVAWIARGTPRWWKGVLATLLVIIGSLTIESGLLIGVVAVACWLVGWRGIPGRAVLAVVAVVAAYFYLRFGVLEISSPGLEERAAGWWLDRLDTSELVARFGANPLPFYAYNVMASAFNVLFSEPRGGIWSIARRWVEDNMRPWAIIHVISSLLVTGVMLAALAPALRRWYGRTLEDRDRFVILAFIMIAANSVLSFGYVKDEVLSVGAVFYAAGAFAAFAGLAGRIDGGTMRRAVVVVLLMSSSVLWSSRAAATFFSLQASAFKVANDWAKYSLENECEDLWNSEASRRAYQAMRARSLSYNVPHPVFTKQQRVDRYLEVQ